MRRRRFLRTVGTGAALGLAGCSARPTGTTEGGTTGTTVGTTREDRTLRVATYPPFLDAPSSSPGDWLKREFESRVDATLKWFAPEQEIDYFIQRQLQGLTVDTDMYIGLVNLDLVQVDTKLGDATLFAETPVTSIEGGEYVPERFRFDTSGRVVPFSHSFVSFVYKENGVPSKPDTYGKLAKPAFENGLLLSNPQSSVTGKMFLLMTINEYGEEYLEYWSRLQDNGVNILGSWGDAYNAYSNGEAPIVVSYSTDQVYAARYDQDMSRHRVAFPDGQGYAYIEGMAKFADTENPDLCDRFMEFILSPDVQREIGKRNVTMPIAENASLPPDLQDLVYEPENPVSFSYDRLKGNLNTWVDEWSKQIASK